MKKATICAVGVVIAGWLFAAVVWGYVLVVLCGCEAKVKIVSEPTNTVFYLSGLTNMPGASASYIERFYEPGSTTPYKTEIYIQDLDVKLTPEQLDEIIRMIQEELRRRETGTEKVL